MAVITPDPNNYSIEHMKPIFASVMAEWIDSLHLPEQEPMEWIFSRGVVRDLEKEVDSEWACWKPGIDFTLTIVDGETRYTQRFLKTEDGWKIDDAHTS